MPVRGGAASALCVEDTLSALRRRDAELAALAAHRDSLLHDREQLARKLATCQAALDDMHVCILSHTSVKSLNY